MKRLLPIFDTDSYKQSHFLQYPKGTQKVFSYLEARTGTGFQDIVFFGLQYIIKNTLMSQITMKDVDFAQSFFSQQVGPFNYDGWRYIVEKHNGYLPLEIKAVPEGTVLARGNVLVTIENTDINCAWLPQYIEDIIVRVWSTINVATLSYHMKKAILAAFEKTSDDLKDSALFKLVDFGSRGAYSQEAAGVGGMGHLVNFMVTDNIPSILYAQDAYNTNAMLGYSIPASEHSTTVSWTEEREQDVYENMINQFGGKYPLFAMVMDSYDLENAVRNIIGKNLKDKILNCGSTVVIRPDSGVPKDSVLSCLQWLDEAFGTEVNSKGYKVLHKSVRVIQGDGVNYDSLVEIIDYIVANGYSIDNVAFGSGGGLLQAHNRDTYRIAQKCSYIEIDGVGMGVRKMPKTDPTKASKAGRLKLIKVDGVYKTIEDNKHLNVLDNELKTVYYFNHQYGLDKPTFNEIDFQQVRANTKLW